MPLSQADIDDLKQRYRGATGVDLSDQAARQLGERLLALYRLLQHPERAPDP